MMVQNIFRENLKNCLRYDGCSEMHFGKRHQLQNNEEEIVIFHFLKGQFPPYIDLTMF